MNGTDRRVIVVTGASAGVGRATVRAFANRGCSIGLIARGSEGLEAAAEEVRHADGLAIAVAADVADPEAVERAADSIEHELGPIDVWINAAMATVYAPFHEITPAEYKRATEVTYLGYVYGTMAALKRMRRRNRGTIVQVGSALSYRAIPLQAPYCGAKFAIRGFTDSLRSIRFIQVRHEEAAAFMACAHAKYTGRLGCCLATSGPGGIHLLNGLYDAKLDGAPVIAVTGLQFHDLLHTFTQQDVELDKLFMDVCVYNARVMGPAHVKNVVELACRTALAYRGVSHVTIPTDVQSLSLRDDWRSARNIPHHVSDLMAESAHMPGEAHLQVASELLNEGKKVCILAGRGTLHARDQLTAMAERLAAPLCKPLLGKAALPDTSEYSAGGVGLLGTRPAQEALEDCDTLLIAGSSFPYIEFYPKPGRAKCVQIDIDPKRIGLRYPAHIGLVGDCARVLGALLPKIQPKQDRSFLSDMQRKMKDWRALMEERGTRRDKPMKPGVVAHELNKLVTNDAIISTDSGTITTWIARHLDIHGNQQFSCSGNLATMACGLPYAIAAAVAYPGRQSIAFVGDGGLTMLMGELATCVKYNLDVKVVVIKNGTLGQIKWEQIVFLGNPEYACELQPIDFAAAARAFGVTAFSIDDPEKCGETLRQALATPGPVLVEAVVDPNEPPLPPKVTLEQAAHFAESLARGTPNARKIALTVGSDVVRELV